MAQQTPLYEQHVLCGARMVDFHGWMMPLHYGSQIDEHHAVRTDAGMFDVSHMTIVDLRGSRTREFLRYLLANDVAKLKTPGKALYTGMLNASGGVIDDLIVYYFTEDFFRLVVNSATREKDLSWITQHAEPYAIDITVRDDLSLIAVQGPNAQELLGDMVFVDLPDVGTTVSAGDDCAVAESVKAASDIYAPVSGEIVAVNDALSDSPELVNSEPYEGGWIFKIKASDESQVAALLDATAYEALLEDE